MKDVICIYYSRTGTTEKAIRDIARALDCEAVSIQDERHRNGPIGWLRCGMDAMRPETERLRPFVTERPLKDYRLVILGTPVWAGRCSAVMRGFLKTYGSQLQQTAYLITRAGSSKYEEVWKQMDMYVPCGHAAAVSLRSGDAGMTFWQQYFLQQVKELL